MAGELIRSEHIMSVSQILSVGFLLLLTMVDTTGWVVVPALILWGISSAFFWLSNHYNLSFVRQNDQTSQEVGIIYILLTVARALGPFIGGVIATQIDFSYTLLLAVVFLVGAAYVITSTPEQAPLPSFDLKQDMLSGWKSICGDILANFTGQIQGVTGKKLWPFYIFIFLGTFQTVGLVKSISIIGSIVILYIVGKRGDDGKNDQQLRFGSRWSSLIHVLRPLAQTFSVASIIDLASQFTGKIYKVPFLSYYYKKSSKSQSRIGYINKMEISAGLGKMTAWLLLTATVTMLSTLSTITVMFYIAAIAVLFKTWIIPKKER